MSVLLKRGRNMTRTRACELALSALSSRASKRRAPYTRPLAHAIADQSAAVPLACGTGLGARRRRRPSRVAAIEACVELPSPLLSVSHHRGSSSDSGVGSKLQTQGRQSPVLQGGRGKNLRLGKRARVAEQYRQLPLRPAARTGGAAGGRARITASPSHP